MPLYVTLTIVLGLTGILLVALIVLVRSPLTQGHRINNDDRSRKLQGSKLHRHAAVNMVFSGACVYAMTYLPYDYLFHMRQVGWALELGRALGILIVYDLLYYLMHRYLFHQWKPLRKVHALHHAAQFPTAIDALYVHPVETFLGLGLLVFSTYLFGPIHVYTFTGLFFVYSFLNVLIHSGLDLPFFPFRVLTFLAKKHDAHHVSMKQGNFGSISPVWDVLFRTSE